MLVIALFIYLLTITSALFVGLWHKWEYFVVPSFPIALGVFLASFTLNNTYAFIMFLFVFALITYDSFASSILKKQLITFYPRAVLRTFPKALTFAFSLVAAVLVVLKAGQQPQIDIGNTLGELTDKYISPQIDKHIQSQIDEGLTTDQLNSLQTFGLAPDNIELARQSGLLENISGSIPKISLKDQINSQVNNFIEPYKNLVNPLMGLLAFGLITFLGFFARVAFIATIDLVFLVATKSGLLKKELITVSQEVVTF